MNHFVKELAKNTTAKEQKRKRAFLNGLVDYIKEEVLSGNIIHIPNFGIFEIRGNKSKMTNTEPSRSSIDWPKTHKFWESRPTMMSKVWILKESAAGDNYHYRFYFRPRGSRYFKMYTFRTHERLKKDIKEYVKKGTFYSKVK